MTTRFNFSGLHPAFCECVQRHEPTLAFALEEGRGRFVFLLFLATDRKGSIKWGKLDLFILLSRTQRMLRFDLYGNQYQGRTFDVYVKPEDELAIREELGLSNATEGPRFQLSDFLAKLNAMIPTTIPLVDKIRLMNSEKSAIMENCTSHFEDLENKRYLLRVGALPEGKQPREETLRKLYMLNAPPKDIALLIERLKSRRWTAFWTATEPDTDNFAEIFASAMGL